MTDVSPTSDTPESSPVLTFGEFLESHPPNQMVRVERVGGWYLNQNDGSKYLGILAPEIQLHCPHEACNGVRFFRCISKPAKISRLQFVNDYLTYRCCNCQKTEKIFSVSVRLGGGDVSEFGDAIKFGEIPPFGPPAPTRLIKLIGPDRDAFLSGRRCENQGLGIGAFVYYRRVVENQKDRILQEIRRVATKVGAKSGAIKLLEDAEKEVQFSKAMEMAKPGLPESLLIDGHNPLGLLHSALSEGVHELKDEECLILAGSIRVVLGELSERIAQALKDEDELKKALSSLLNRKKS